ncbi:glycosyltransferase [Actinomadura parmotrematis]|uniref:4,4'-diaponeurosporenoate glycosyltransferase n=1 Tax=Actinomadura parmotrematis TaxID=2864039 RepID=A0ABS7FPY5_9ACTN|nr:glycosyltransferase family 2 protein [Actinomadura parmotrematis]MBW8482437.1 glycosyltransferase family 2 protein [Actinomadura parmotrematis]
MIAGVVVPAHDEEDLLGACLAALAPARVPVVVVADACTDGTARLARALGAHVVEIAARNVGAARAAGAAELLRRGARWIATTDADTVVPPDWTDAQLACAARGWDAVAGSVTVLDWQGRPGWLPGAFAARYGGPGVHGANLGCSARAYRAAGGFRPLRTGEDRALVAALEAAGRRVLHTTEISVVTSARRRHRAPHGFGHLLNTLAARGPAGGPVADVA